MPKDNEGHPVEPSLIDRVTQGVRYMVSGVKPTTWMGPGQPINPIAQEAKGRQFDYQVGFNYQFTPRAGEVGFDTLRFLADGLDILRLAIETRKDQMGRQKWLLRMKDRKAKADLTRIEALRLILLMPDREHDFATWLRMLIEDLLVLDAPCVYSRPSLAGTPYAFEVMDGALMKRVLTEDGRTPVAPDPAYQQVIKNVPAADYSRDELLYLPRNPRSNRVYGFSPVQQVIVTVNLAIRRQIHQLQYYTEGNVPEAVVEMPENLTAKQVEEFQGWWDSILEGNTAERRHMKFIPGPAKINWTKEAVLKDQMDEWLARVICYAFSLPPTPFVQQMNRATAGTAQEAALEEGLAPLMAWAERLMNLILEKYLGVSDIEFAWEREEVRDELKAAKSDEIYVRNGVKSIDEVREGLGLEPIGVGHGVLTDQGFVPLAMTYEKPAPPAPPGLPEPKEEPAEMPENKNPNEEQAAPEKVEKAAKKETVRISPDQADADDVAHYGRIIADFLQVQAKRCAKAMSRKFAELTKADVADEAKVKAILEELKREDWAFLVDPSQKVMEKVSKKAGSMAVKSVRVGAKQAESLLNLANKRAISYAEKRSAELVGMIWTDEGPVVNWGSSWSIAEETRNLIRGDVVSALEDGWGPDELKAALLDPEKYAFSAGRAAMIARTELGLAHMDAAMEVFRDSGMVSRKMVLLGSEHEVEDICNDNLDDGWIGIDEEFSSGDDAPPFHPNCVCALDIELSEPGAEPNEPEDID